MQCRAQEHGTRSRHWAFGVLLGLTPLAFAQSTTHPGGQHTDHAAHAPGVTSAPAARASGEARKRVSFPARLKEHTLANMRDHLLALAEIQTQLAGQHFDAAAEIAEQRLGMSSLQGHGAHEVAKYMPPGMRDAGSAMHHAASRFALTAQEATVDRDTGHALAALAALTQTCVACHAAYRLR